MSACAEAFTAGQRFHLFTFACSVGSSLSSPSWCSSHIYPYPSLPCAPQQLCQLYQQVVGRGLWFLLLLRLRMCPRMSTTAPAIPLQLTEQQAHHCKHLLLLLLILHCLVFNPQHQHQHQHLAPSTGPPPALLSAIAQSDPSRWQPTARSWWWQKCFELAYWQVGQRCEDGGERKWKGSGRGMRITDVICVVGLFMPGPLATVSTSSALHFLKWYHL